MTQVGERYSCSSCGCEIEVTSSGRTQDQSFVNEPSSWRPIGGSATGETGVGSLRNAEAAGISTPGDFGSQGATGEGIFGTSGGGQRSTASGRLGSTTAALHSSPTGSPASQTAVGSSASEPSSETQSFSCCCGQPMSKSSASSRGLSRSAQA
jgi:hypothetical protein